MHHILQQEIKQQKPFLHLQEEVWLNLSRTAAAAGHTLEQKLRPHGLSLTQYNVLRILRGTGMPGLCQYEIAERLVAQVPDVPRILERMERAHWITRSRGTRDRRMVITTLTETGLQMLIELDEPIAAVLASMFPRLSQDQMSSLNELLVVARNH